MKKVNLTDHNSKRDKRKRFLKEFDNCPALEIIFLKTTGRVSEWTMMNKFFVILSLHPMTLIS